jgi:hypothetical protein
LSGREAQQSTISAAIFVGQLDGINARMLRSAVYTFDAFSFSPVEAAALGGGLERVLSFKLSGRRDSRAHSNTPCPP